TVTVPAKRAEIPPAGPAATARHVSDDWLAEISHWNGFEDACSPAGLASGKRARVLLADDNRDMRDYARRLLESNFDVVAVCDGEQALAEARSHPPDLVLSDVMMPRLDGFGLLAALRADPRTSTTPVILLSARAGEESRVEGLQAGAD